MKILYIMRHQGYVRNADHVIRALADQGHQVHIFIAGKSQRDFDRNVLWDICAYSANIAWGLLPQMRFYLWEGVSGVLRAVMDYLRYFDLLYDRAPKLKERSASRLPGFLRTLADFFFSGITQERRKKTTLFIRKLDACFKPHPDIVRWLKKFNPDLILFTPLLDFSSDSSEYLKAARVCGLKTVLCVASWDNLSNKGLIHFSPDRILVWNEIQKKEAIEMHYMEESSIAVTGAHLFDHWFEMKPSRSRNEFAHMLDFDPAQKTLIYVCSSAFIAQKEISFVREWLRAIRASSFESLRDANILIRPHPGNGKEWSGDLFQEISRCAVWPPYGEGPTTPQAKQNYYDSIYYSDLVVGINTSAQVEAAILAKPIFTILREEFEDTQEGTVHFRYLVELGMMQVSKNLEEHLSHMQKALHDPSSYARLSSRFTEVFLRPRGRDHRAAPFAAEEILATIQKETLLEKKPERLASWGVRLGFFPVAVILNVFISFFARIKKSKSGLTKLFRHRWAKQHKDMSLV